MKTNKSILKTFMAAAMMFVFVSTANAQFPKIGKGTNIGKVIKNKAEGTVENIANKAVDKAQEKARKKMYEIVKKKVLDGKQMPECPWPMNENVMSYVRMNEGNSTVLMHDLDEHYNTIEALPSLIETLLSEGYEICPIDENTKPVQHYVVD